ncbi:Arylsulfatase [Tautonia plasticadhaerens]|uniref:Arylsulfatase n=1 Tax=Tautonia plasticadhaerens TaxID=2527974 RepID=A0A518GZS6_9BACT|nr:Arylsulfatase [Tautonia plasticadhaerens]
MEAPAGSPNVLLILLDDVGFGMCSTFGGPVETPNLQELADNGISYTRFHTTALCSPTRAALLAGRNHHSVGTGVIIEMGTGYPGYTGIIPRSTALLPKILGENGFATAMFGKWHNTPEPEISPAGPFDRWPTGLGFDEFYGFNQGEAHQFYPTLYRNTVPVEPPSTPEQGYHLTEDLVDEAIAWTRNIDAADPDKPWFAYFSTDAVHAPHHVPADWRGPYKGKFDHGWDRQRELTHARQLELGMIPPGTKLTPRPEEIPAWDETTEDERKVYLRLMENYAEYMAHTDHEVGRLIESLEQSGELDNTLVLYLVGDNGASAEGGLEGTFNELASLLGVQLGLESTINRIDEIGGPTSEPHVPVGWAWAMDAPFKWTKQVASHFGGTRNPLVVRWPAGFEAMGERRTQSHHAIDVVPTILEACKLPEPTVVNGIPQKPIEGVSMAYTFDSPDAESRRTTQYFEMVGNRGIYHDGWLACSRFGVPWQTAGREGDILDTPWELYHIDEDFSQAVDLADEQPEKLQELVKLFFAEAAEYDVLPLDDRKTERLDVANRPSLTEGRTTFTYPNRLRLPEGATPDLKHADHTFSARVTIPEGGAEGMLLTLGGRFAGFGLFLKGGMLVYHYNLAGVDRYQVASDEPVPPGDVTLRMVYVSDSDDPGAGATVTLFADDTRIGEGRIERSLPNRVTLDETLDVGFDTGTPVVDDYPLPFAFTGRLDSVTISLD